MNDGGLFSHRSDSNYISTIQSDFNNLRLFSNAGNV